MKRICVFLICICLFLSGCRNTTALEHWQPSKASAAIEPYARRAIEVIDEYLTFKMTSDEATKAFSELCERIKPFDITGLDSKYSDPDRTIAHSINMLAIGRAEGKTDLEYQQYRDMLAFQIGEPVSGTSYAADRSVLDLDDDGQAKERLGELIDINSVPFDWGSISIGDNFLSGSLYFDVKNGVQISDLQPHIATVYDNLVKKGIERVFFSFHYSRFEQDIFSLYLDVFDGVFTGSVQRVDAQAMAAYSQLSEKYTAEEIAEMKEYPKEFAILNPLYEFNSIENLPEALSVASVFSGVE